MHPAMLLRSPVAALALVGASVLAQVPPASTYSAANLSALETRHLKAEPAEYLGRKAVKLTTATPSDESGFAILPGADFQDGTIEADIAVRITTPPGVRMPGFSGIAFRMKPDATEYELIYLRPGNALAGDQAMRNHVVQYSAEPHHGWYRLRREWPFVYESYADIKPEAWIRVRIEVAGRSAKLFLNQSANPSLVVDGLKTSSLRGGVALWSYAAEETFVSEVRITPAPAAPLRNGSDASGVWDVKVATDAGPFAGTLHLTRNANALTGSWSGDLGKDQPVTGTWRDGYIEITLPAEWPKGGDGQPGPTTAVLDGWVDDAAIKGRIRVEGRTMGTWTGARQAP